MGREKNGFPSAGQTGFRKGFTTLDHNLTFGALIKEGRAHNNKILCCFVDFWKAINTTTCSAHAVARSPWSPYRYAMGCCRRAWLDNWSKTSAYYHAVSLVSRQMRCQLHYIERFSGSGACLAGITIQILSSPC